jgi:hypothetical protein
MMHMQARTEECLYLRHGPDTKEVGDVLEVSGIGVFDGSANIGIAVTIKTGNGLWGGTLSRITRLRRRAIGRTVGLLLGLRALLCWTGHCRLRTIEVMLVVFGNEEAFASSDDRDMRLVR